jgi:hypothetical protein
MPQEVEFQTTSAGISGSAFPIKIGSDFSLGIRDQSYPHVVTSTHFGMNGLARLFPRFRWALESESIDSLDGSIDCDPGHHLGMGEMPSRAAHFPDPLVRPSPGGLDEIDQAACAGPRISERFQAQKPRMIERIDHFSMNVQLKLLGGGIANADRLRSLVAGQPIQDRMKRANRRVCATEPPLRTIH